MVIGLPRCGLGLSIVPSRVLSGLDGAGTLVDLCFFITSQYNIFSHFAIHFIILCVTRVNRLNYLYIFRHFVLHNTDSMV